MARRKTATDIMEKAYADAGAARVADPDEHFPYKIEAVGELIEQNPAMGPGVPDELDGTDDRSREVADYITPAIAAASADYVAAQQAYLLDRNDDTLAEYNAARDQLLAARLDHRAHRGSTFTVGAAARRAG